MHINPRIHKPASELRIAIVTPTYQRAAFLSQTWRYVQQQNVRAAALEWWVLDDSPEPHPQLPHINDARLHYHWLADKQILGYKRNWLNAQAAHAGADIICAMDDDDWYGADYVADLVDLLLNHDTHFAGCSANWYYSLADGGMYYFPAVRPDKTCNGFMAYTTDVLHTQRYDDQTRQGEESDFLGKFTVVQHPAPERVHVALAHPHNTVTKRNIVHPSGRSDWSLEDIPMSAADKAFYLNLTQPQP